MELPPQGSCCDRNRIRRALRIAQGVNKGLLDGMTLSKVQQKQGSFETMVLRKLDFMMKDAKIKK
ncbi:hypothetical protein [Hyphomonas johnsonii]|uniref:hypothetical protein n=1 Tax=Hyphomonas johnsonii TaxID=81031 RepID=UPI0012EB75B3|nr:hypothetical protein [Hyphomonas johnsonii]